MSGTPEPSSAPFSLTKASENFSRLCQLILTVCSDLFRDILSRYIKPANLRRELDSNKQILNNVTNSAQNKLLYPPPGVPPVSAKDLDLSLLYVLLRNICKIPKHQNGWGNDPKIGDNSLAACIERIRIHRNKITGHSASAKIDDVRFQDVWSKLENDIVNIENDLTGAEMYRTMVKGLLDCDLTPSKAQKYVETFKQLYDKMDDVHSQTKNTLDDMRSETNQNCARKAARLKSIERRQITFKRKWRSQYASKKARIGKLEKQQSTATSDIKDQLKETEEHFLYVLQGRLSGIQQYMEERLSTVEENMEVGLSGIQERLSTVEENMEGGMAVIKKEMKDMKSRFSPLVLTSTIDLSGIGYVAHISLVTSNLLWVSDEETLHQVDATGTVIRTLDDKYEYYSHVGAHAVSVDGDFVFIARGPDSVQSTTSGRRCGVYKMTSDGNITCLFKTDQYPKCLYCSHNNGHILIGMMDDPYRGVNVLVQRYDNTGRKIQDIELNDAGERPYRRLNYITENRINGDIVVSDGLKNALVVVDELGRHRFNYTGRSTERRFSPLAVCTDLLGRILLAYECFDESNRYGSVCCISLLDQDGHYLTRLLTVPEDEFGDELYFSGLCVDDKNKIYASYGSKIKVFT